MSKIVKVGDIVKCKYYTGTVYHMPPRFIDKIRYVVGDYNYDKITIKRNDGGRGGGIIIRDSDYDGEHGWLIEGYEWIEICKNKEYKKPKQTLIFKKEIEKILKE